MKISDIQDSKEAIGFVAELLKGRLHDEQGIFEDRAVAKGLWDILVLGKLTARHPFSNFVLSIFVTVSTALSGLLINKFGLKQKHTISNMLFIVSFISMATAGLFLGFISKLTIYSTIPLSFFEKASYYVVVLVFLSASIFLLFSEFNFVTKRRFIPYFNNVNIRFFITLSGLSAFVIMSFFSVFSSNRLIESFETINKLNGSFIFLFNVISMVCIIVSISLVYVLEIISNKDGYMSDKIYLWFYACKSIFLPKLAIEETAGKGMLVLLESTENDKHK